MRMLLPLMLAVAARSGATTWRKVGTVKGYEGMKAEMQHLVDTNPNSRSRLNHLCVVVEDDGDDPKHHPTVPILAYVHWREHAHLYAFDQTAFPPIDDASIWGAASVDLRKDVVRTAREIHGSTNRVTRAFVDGIIDACAAHGDSYVMEKHGG